MPSIVDEWQHDAYEKNCTKFLDRFVAFLELPENWNRLKKVENSDDLRQLLNEAFRVAFPNPYNKTPILGVAEVRTLLEELSFKELNRKDNTE